MHNHPTLAKHMTGDRVDEMARYQAIAGELLRFADTTNPTLRAHLAPWLHTFLEGEFSQIVALLPFWLSDLLPVSPRVCHELGIAHLYGWWYYDAQDKLLDGAAPPSVLLGGHLALVRMLDMYGGLGVTTAPCWAEFHRLSLTSAELYAVELSTRFTSPNDLTPARLAPWTLDLIMRRGAPFYFNTIAQMHLAGITKDAPLHEDLIEALRCFTAARQIGDDAGDWLTDLQTGHLNYVSANLILRMCRSGSAVSGTDLSVERLAGYHIADEIFWDEIETTSCELYQRALGCLAPHGDCRLRELIERQRCNQDAHWANRRAARAKLRELFGVSPH